MQTHIYVPFQIYDFFGGTGKKVQKILNHLKLKNDTIIAFLSLENLLTF
jgi:hypothetical protein